MAPSPTVRRLLKEVAELSSSSSNPNPAFFAAPVSDADLHEWHFTLVGPPAPSPYAGGMYHGRITLPTTYPLKPPNFRFLTPSGRFEVNREICLSISGFHEETWMPAWGIRTALTALRSFIAEQGSAGQVGGLEASQEVRKRLAKESRTWKCDLCQKTNETIMREWWEICREAGVSAHEEDLGLESLPEGMALEDRSPTATAAATTNEGISGTKSVPSRDSVVSEQTVSLPPTVTSPDSSASGILRPPTPPTSDSSSALRPPDQASASSSVPLIPSPSPSAEAVQAAAEAVLTPSDLALPAPSNPSRPPHHSMMSSIHAPPIAAANAAVVSRTAQPLQRRPQQEHQTVTIDRAIAGVFLALCFMVLKKIFYPAGSGGYGDIDDFYLQRE
ncbi:Ubiquitin-conjugating enzyme E2 J1 [Exophiala dermatitidis]